GGVIMTNHHVIPDSGQASGSVSEFGFEPEETPLVTMLDPERLFVTSPDLDFTLVAVDPVAVRYIAPIPLTRSPAIVTRHDRVNIVQHPRGRPKEVALHDNRVVRVRDRVIRYVTDTEPGSSGSPVFNNDWQIVALHRAGLTRDDGSAENEGVKVSAIVSYLTRLRREGLEGNAVLDQVLEELLGISPFLGFFDTAGLDGSGPEVELPDFTGTPDFADIGVWNIEHFNDTVSDERIGAVADVVARLSLDVMGMTEVQEGALDRLATRLLERGIGVGHRVLDVPGGQDLGVLFDEDTSEVELRDYSQRFETQLSATTQAGKSAFPRPPLFAHCRVRDGNGPDVQVILIVVHLKAFGDAESRARRRLASEMLTEMIDSLRHSEGIPVVLGGDFNDELSTGVFDSLRDSPDLLSLTSDDDENGAISYVGGSHRSLIDHFVVSRDARMGAIAGDDAAIIRRDKTGADFSATVSDHVPLVFRMVFREESEVVPDDRSGLPGASVPIPPGSTQVHVRFTGPDGEPPVGEAEVVISAVLPSPIGGAAGQETVALTNHGPAGTNLAGWRITDAAGGEEILGDLPLAAGASVEVPVPNVALNNDGDTRAWSWRSSTWSPAPSSGRRSCMPPSTSTGAGSGARTRRPSAPPWRSMAACRIVGQRREPVTT
ncbi:MAG: trypsin-like peptidase domain-containing protein, partial [Gemmatimonadota bacterium]